MKVLGKALALIACTAMAITFVGCGKETALVAPQDEKATATVQLDAETKSEATAALKTMDLSGVEVEVTDEALEITAETQEAIDAFLTDLYSSAEETASNSRRGKSWRHSVNAYRYQVYQFEYVELHHTRTKLAASVGAAAVQSRLRRAGYKISPFKLYGGRGPGQSGWFKIIDGRRVKCGNPPR